VDQVVHDYGDLCQAITELAKEINAPVAVDEFHTLNRFLDDSIGSAVSAYGRHQQLGTLAVEQRTQLNRALAAFDALQVGSIADLGTTGTVLEDSLLKLRDLVDRSLPGS
jgi:hypothetical protein